MKPTYFSVDLEFTTGNIIHGQVMQIGVVCENGETFKADIPVSTKAEVNDWVKDNLGELLHSCLDLAMYTSTMTKCRNRRGEKVDPSLYGTVHKLQEFVLKNTQAGHAAVMVTYCGGYDFAFTCKLFDLCTVTNPFHYEMLDIASLAIGVLDLNWGYTEAQMLELLGLDENPDKHDALEDARFQMRLFEKLMEARAGKQLASP